MTPPLIKPNPGATINPLHPLARGLVGCWLMNEGAGSSVHDISGKNNHGSLVNNPKWVGSNLGGGLDFSGATDRVNCGNDDSLNVTKITIELWMNSPGTTGTYQFVIDKFYDTGFGVSITTGRGIRPFFNINGTMRFITSNDNIEWGKWNHIVTTFDGSTWIIYLNSRNVKESTSFSGPIGANNYDLNIGQYTVGGYVYNGLVDIVRIYDRALSAREVKQLYRKPFANIISPSVLRLYTPSAPIGWTGTINGVTTPSHICGVSVADILKVNGVS